VFTEEQAVDEEDWFVGESGGEPGDIEFGSAQRQAVEESGEGVGGTEDFELHGQFREGSCRGVGGCGSGGELGKAAEAGDAGVDGGEQELLGDVEAGPEQAGVFEVGGILRESVGGGGFEGDFGFFGGPGEEVGLELAFVLEIDELEGLVKACQDLGGQGEPGFEEALGGFEVGEGGADGLEAGGCVGGVESFAGVGGLVGEGEAIPGVDEGFIELRGVLSEGPEDEGVGGGQQHGERCEERWQACGFEESGHGARVFDLWNVGSTGQVWPLPSPTRPPAPPRTLW